MDPKRLTPLERDGHSVDRISELPDLVLCDILSYVPTKYAARTTFLSTRWKHLFASVPNLTLVFDDSLFPHPHHHPSHRVPGYSSRSFVDFVYSVLNVFLCDVEYVEKIHLICQQDHNSNDIRSWIGAALRFKIKYLVISVGRITSLLLPGHVCYKTLEELTLGREFIFDLPTLICFPNLKVLSLKQVTFHNEDIVNRIFSGCPVLKMFSMKECGLRQMHTFEISSSSLEELEIVHCYNHGVHVVVLDTPALRSIYYDDYVADSYPVKKLNCVCTATIDLELSPHLVEDEDAEWVRRKNICDLVAACCNVEDLSLSCNTIGALHDNIELIPVPTFHNLTTLSLDEFYWNMLPHLLHASPNLEVLIFEEEISDQRGFAECILRLTEDIPRCLSSCLREIQVSRFNWLEDNLELVEFFLRSARMLKKVVVSSDWDPDDLLPIADAFFMLPSCKPCEFVLKNADVTIMELCLM